VRTRIFQIIVGRFACQLQVNEVVRLAEKCGKNGRARNNCRGDDNALSVDNYMAAASESVKFTGPLTTRNYAKECVSAVEYTGGVDGENALNRQITLSAKILSCTRG
jgi:hypothetical protein